MKKKLRNCSFPPRPLSSPTALVRGHSSTHTHSSHTPQSECRTSAEKVKPGSLTIQSTPHEIIIDGLGRISLVATATRPSLPKDAKNCDVRISIHLLPTGANRPVVLTKTLPYPEEKYPS